MHSENLDFDVDQNHQSSWKKESCLEHIVDFLVFSQDSSDYNANRYIIMMSERS